jgi:hypothetical protein
MALHASVSPINSCNDRSTSRLGFPRSARVIVMGWTSINLANSALKNPFDTRQSRSSFPVISAQDQYRSHSSFPGDNPALFARGHA